MFDETDATFEASEWEVQELETEEMADLYGKEYFQYLQSITKLKILHTGKTLKLKIVF